MMTFILVVLLLFLIPGPAVLVTISQTIKGGKKNGIITGLGIAFGDLIHTFAAVLGLSAILMTSAFAFEAVKYIGAAYLIYLGISALINKTKKVAKPTVEKVNPNLSFRQALLIELLNPKTALFFLAFLPQFVRSDSYPVTFQLLMLGLTFVLMSIIYTSFIAFLTSIIGEKLLAKTKQSSNWIGKVAGIVYIGLGLKLAFQTHE
ncbi:LysE family translocator (plasmid) [Bacillus sp. CMF21]|uniref:LysE family translocator n=1 Tax=Metabacillus dongyingensis TaxID=2874282 RepID=UPI001FB3C8A6|nr:LysE family translocator [Metabacillus dongyingensis]UNJ81169.1 Transporter, LysE family [Metabacillus dongyingensis]USK31548.1 LysE family translocator [Bacillus sp. CMF21]